MVTAVRERMEREPQRVSGIFDRMEERTRSLRDRIARSDERPEETLELFREYGSFLEQERGLRKGNVSVIFVPCELESVVSWLDQGYGDIAAAALTITPERAARANAATDRNGFRSTTRSRCSKDPRSICSRSTRLSSH